MHKAVVRLAHEVAMHKSVVRLAHKIAPTFLKENRASDVALALKLRRLFSSYRIDTVIDVGANRGQFRDFLRDRVGFNGRIESFEPIPELAERLKARAASSDREWTVHACALGAEAGEVTINVMAESEFSSFREPLKIADTDMNQMNTVVKRVAVPVTTLDAVFAARTGLRHTYLKLDTQGFDLDVLRGGEQTVAKIQALQTEVSFQPLYKEMPGFAEALPAFGRHGFAVADFFIVSEDKSHRALEFDCVMVR